MVRELRQPNRKQRAKATGQTSHSTKHSAIALLGVSVAAYLLYLRRICLQRQSFDTSQAQVQTQVQHKAQVGTGKRLAVSSQRRAPFSAEDSSRNALRVASEEAPSISLLLLPLLFLNSVKIRETAVSYEFASLGHS